MFLSTDGPPRPKCVGLGLSEDELIKKGNKSQAKIASYDRENRRKLPNERKQRESNPK